MSYDPNNPNFPRWDLSGTRPCRRCGSSVHFGEVTSDEVGKVTMLRVERKQKWMVLDPDLMPHQCKR